MDVLYFFTISLFFQFCCCDTKINIDDTELCMAYLVQRHGDRTPIEKYSFFADDRDALMKEISKYGYENITPRGMQRGYDLGLFIRNRYDKHLSPDYNSSEIYITSTDINRSKMTILTQMAAVFPAKGFRWHKEINWNPVPYTTLPLADDPNAALVSCSSYQNEVDKLFASAPPEMDKYKDLRAQLTNILDYNFTAKPLTIYYLNDFYYSQLSLDIPMRESLKPLLPLIEEASQLVMDLIFGRPDLISRGAGPLLQDFIDHSYFVQDGEQEEVLRILGAHDTNVYTLMAATAVKSKRSVPYYGAMYGLELRKVVKTGQYVVLPVYLTKPGDEVKYLTVEGCDDVFCDFDKFAMIAAQYAIEKTDWRELCNKK